MSYSLIIVDMQEGFYAARNSFTIYYVLKEIKEAKKNKSGIIVVMYENSGRLIRSIDKALMCYQNLDYVWKHKNDGSEAIEESLLLNYFSTKEIRVCGVNTDACVMETTEGLSYALPFSNIEVVEDACNSIDDNDFTWIDYLPNVSLKCNTIVEH